MRQGDTDPEVVRQREAPVPTIHNYLGAIITGLVLLASIVGQWAITTNQLGNAQKDIVDLKANDQLRTSKLSEVDGVTKSLVTRLNAYDSQDIPNHLSKLDANLAAITQQQIDQKAQSDRAHDERIKWQDAMSEKMDKLIQAVGHLEGRQDRSRDK